MKKVNFNTFENLTVSEELMQKALAIPDNAKSASVPFYSRIKSFVTAASFILVFALSVLSFFFFGNKNVVPIAPSSVQNPPYSTTAESTTTSQAENAEPSAPENSVSSQPQTQTATELSTDADGNEIITVITDIISIEQEPTEGGHAEPSEEQSETTTAGTSALDDQPTEQATSPPDVEPVYLYGYFMEPEYGEKYVFKLNIQFSSNTLLQEDSLYCRIYDEERNLLGSPDFYAEDHKVDFSLTDNTVSARYSSDISSEELWRCDHTFEFYDEYGRVLCIYQLLSY